MFLDVVLKRNLFLFKKKKESKYAHEQRPHMTVVEPPPTVGQLLQSVVAHQPSSVTHQFYPPTAVDCQPQSFGAGNKANRGLFLASRDRSLLSM